MDMPADLTEQQAIEWITRTTGVNPFASLLPPAGAPADWNFMQNLANVTGYPVTLEQALELAPSQKAIDQVNAIKAAQSAASPVVFYDTSGQPYTGNAPITGADVSAAVAGGDLILLSVFSLIALGLKNRRHRSRSRVKRR